MNRFIVIEGLEGAGKTTVHQAVVDYLQAQGATVTAVREPGGTPLAEELRLLVKSPRAENVAPMTELLLMVAARVQLVNEVIKPALAAGKWVVGDRHLLSTLAYQGAGRGLDEKQILALHQLALGTFAPALTLYLDIDPAIGITRARGRGELDRIEQQGLAFFERARVRYQQAVDGHSVIAIDASQTPAQVRAAVLAQLQAFLNA